MGRGVAHLSAASGNALIYVIPGRGCMIVVVHARIVDGACLDAKREDNAGNRIRSTAHGIAIVTTCRVAFLG